MINPQLVNPESIVVVGASDNIRKPGGKVLKNILDGDFKGKLFGINPKLSEVQGIKCYSTPEELPEKADLAIISIPSVFVNVTVKKLINTGTKAFIVLSAGFKESGEKGARLEAELTETIDNAGASLIGPNCMGVLSTTYRGTFAGPIPELKFHGADFASGSGATAAFIMEAGIDMGLPFSNMFSVGNSAQNGVEEVIEYWDETYNPETDSRVKLLYMEKIEKPEKFLKHASSLIRKGCDIAAIKAGASEAGNRAASSHTGAMASSDAAVDALFKKAGVIRCYSREELMLTAAVFLHKKPAGKRFAIITHAGGPGVMLSDTLSNAGFEVPVLEGEEIEKLKSRLYPGSSVANPIDFLATGTAEQLADIIDTVEHKINNIDAMAVIFGTPGLTDVTPVYKVIYDKMQSCKKPIFPVLPSVYTAAEAIDNFKSWGGIAFTDEVLMGRIIAQNYFKTEPHELNPELTKIDEEKIRKIIDSAESGYLNQADTTDLLEAADIPVVKQQIIFNITELDRITYYPAVMKVNGIVHKTEVNGVRLNIRDKNEAEFHFKELMQIEGVNGVLVQPMLSGTELFVGAKYEDNFGHLIMFGLGGIYVEIFKDVVKTLAPVGKTDALSLIKELKSAKFFEGVRGRKPLSASAFADVITSLSSLLRVAPEIYEMDLNPLLATYESVIAVDARINILKKA